jgi:DNA-binding transcriptional LysR family regulator
MHESSDREAQAAFSRLVHGLATGGGPTYIRAEPVSERPRVELRHLRYFVAVAEEATFVAAARRLGVAQPALTRQIHALERELDVDLLERTPKGTTLTPAGEVALTSARHVLRQVDAVIERARGSSRGVAGRCVLCAGDRSLASGLVGRIGERVRTTFPAIELHVIEGALLRQFQALRLAEADIGMGAPPTQDAYPDLASESVDVDILDAVVVASSHRLARRRRVALRELADDTLLIWSEESDPELRRRLREEFARLEFQPAAIREVDNLFSLATGVAAGRGWTFVHSDQRGLVPPGVVVIPITDVRIPLPHAIVWRADERRPVVRTVIDIVREEMRAERAAREGRAAAARHNGTVPAMPAPKDPVPPSATLELRHLRYFCAVAGAGSFGRAAEHLGLTQPALSRQVADLERVAATPLLERTARGVATTPAGETLARGAQRILDEVEAVAQETQRARRGVIARCVLATIPTPLARRIVTALVHECAREQPELEFVFEEVPTPEQPEALRSARVDLGICHPSPLTTIDERGIDRARLTYDLMNCALVSAGDALARRRSLSIRELADVPFIFPDRSFQPALYDMLFGEFARLGFEPRLEAIYDGLRTIWQSVALGHGWAMGFSSQCDDPPSGTASVPIDELSIPWGLDVLVRADDSRSLILDVVDRLHCIGRTLR